MGLTISGNPAADTRATVITGGAMTWGSFWGVDASVANGAQVIAAMFDRESTTLFQAVRGTSGTANLGVAVSDAALTGYARADAVATAWSVNPVVAV
jgi:hypothetical protein